MKLISWNVNGIRAVLKKGFLDFLESEQPDVLCLQEIKIAQKDIEKTEFDFPGYEEYWCPAQRPGYSGTAILVKSSQVKKVESYHGKFGVDKFDVEGRVQILELGKFYLVNAYFPNANHELSRLDYKIEFNDQLLAHLKKLEKAKPVIICGDFNVAHQAIDLARPKENEGSPGYTYEERVWMTKFLGRGFVDTFRRFYPEKAAYTWWSYRARAREHDVGWRIDYFCVSESFTKSLKEAFILNRVYGSDHCPVGIVCGALDDAVGK